MHVRVLVAELALRLILPVAWVPWYTEQGFSVQPSNSTEIISAEEPGKALGSIIFKNFVLRFGSILVVF